MPNQLGLVAALVCSAGAAWAAPAEREPRLTGIVIVGEQRLAMFDGIAGRATVVARVGDDVGGERVTAIETRVVRLAGPDGARSVTLGEDAVARAVHVAPTPLIDPYRRERELENDQ